MALEMNVAFATELAKGYFDVLADFFLRCKGEPISAAVRPALLVCAWPPFFAVGMLVYVPSVHVKTQDAEVPAQYKRKAES
ncbi:MAG: hypothetical protein Q8P50_19255 [Bacillota bacterium]|nr:hypothetical protein [Bacillota bacterium]